MNTHASPAHIRPHAHQSKGFCVYIPPIFGPDIDPLTHTSIMAIPAEMWPHLKSCEIGIGIEGHLLRMFPADPIPVERAIFTHTIHNGKVVYRDYASPLRLAHLALAVDANLGRHDHDHIVYIRPDKKTIEVIRIPPE